MSGRWTPAEDRLRQVNPEARLDPRHAFFHHDTADDLLGGVDFVIDASTA